MTFLLIAAVAVVLAIALLIKEGFVWKVVTVRGIQSLVAGVAIAALLGFRRWFAGDDVVGYYLGAADAPSLDLVVPYGFVVCGLFLIVIGLLLHFIEAISAG